MPYRAVAFTALFLHYSVAFAATPVSGKVVDSEGASISKAQVFVFSDEVKPNGNLAGRGIAKETDRHGHFAIELDQGFYDVCVMSSAFTPQCRKILVTTNGSKISDFKLVIDPLFIKERGDTFSK